jgi:catechol 2,3-dioxygenase-like lactoylglutathione lyase family enzyme
MFAMSTPLSDDHDGRTAQDTERPPPTSGDGVLARSDVQTRLPAQDLERARRFYAEKLGLHPIEERPGGLRYRCGSTLFALFASGGEPSGQHTQMSWKVEDIDEAVAELRARGVVFDDDDLPGVHMVDGIADIEGNYPSDGGIGERAVWFHDSEGNILGIGQAKR